MSLSTRQLRRILKKRALFGNAPATLTNTSRIQNLEQLVKLTSEILELAHAAGEIHLKYLDESGFSLWSGVSYTWAKQGQQKRIEQTLRRGKRYRS